MNRGIGRRVLRGLGLSGSFRMVPTGEAHECMYGDLYGATGDCTVIVAPRSGWRQNGMVFCSDEHAARDQEEQIL